MDIAAIWIEKDVRYSILAIPFTQPPSQSYTNFSKKNKAEELLKNVAKMLIEIEARFTFHICHQH